MSATATRIVVVDDHPVFRDALASYLGLRPGLVVVGVTASIRDTQSLLERQAADLLIVDLSLEDGSGYELARAVHRARMETRVLIMTGFRDAFAATEAFAAGVSGYFLKEQSTDDLFKAIRAVVGGETYISPLISTLMRADGRRQEDNDLLNRLSRREREIFRLVVAGSGTKEIAKRLFVSVKTVETHRTNVNKKLGVRTTANLIRFAAAHGITIAPGASR